MAAWQAELAQKHPAVRIRYSDHSVGGATPLQAHAFALECLLTWAAPDEPDLIVLEVVLARLDAAPELHSADVTGFDGMILAELSGLPTSLSAGAISELTRELPNLRDALDRALTDARR